MVATVNNIAGAGQAGHYYAEVDDYYRAGEQAPSRWFGRLADKLGLSGAVGPAAFTSVLQGNFPGEEIPTANGKHRPGTDITFSPDKSVSEMALRAGDERIVEAVWAAAQESIAELQERVGARIKRDGEIDFERTGNLMAAMFAHTSSRNLDPQLHIHAIILNATRTPDGKLRALDNSTIYQSARDLGQSFHTRLGAKLQALGYVVDKHILRSGLATAGIRGVPEAIMDKDSTRAAAVEKNLAKMGLSRADCSRAQAEIAALKGRKRKKQIDHPKLHERWREEGRILEGGALLNLHSAAKTNAHNPPSPEARARAADAAVGDGAEHLVERAARFTHSDLERAARGNAVGTGVGVMDVRAAIDRAKHNGKLIGREVERFNKVTRKTDFVAAFTTPEAIREEKQMLAAVRAGRGQAAPLTDEETAKKRIADAEKNGPYEWNESQRSASLNLLTSSDAVVGLQGYAGTAKSTTVLKQVAQAGAAAGLEVIGMAPSTNATETLREGTGLQPGQAMTVAKYLATAQTPAEQKRAEFWEAAANGKPIPDGFKRRLILVDEASLMGAKDTSLLLDNTRRAGDRVVLVGDVRQLGSVGRGEAFKQLQDAGMPTAKLDQIVRQRSADAKEAVQGILARDASRAMEALKKQPDGGIREIPNAARGDPGKARRLQIAQDYLSLRPEERVRSIVIDPTRAGRAELNKMIRSGLKQEGTIGKTEIKAQGLEARNLTDAQVHDVAQYKEGNIVMFSRDRRREGIVGGEVYHVTKVDTARKELHLSSPAGNTQHVIRPEQVGRGKMAAFTSRDFQLAQGDKVAWTKNDKALKLKNGDRGTVLEVTDKSAKIRFGAGKETQTVDVDLQAPRPMRHDYATTIHAAQGRTADRVLAHVETSRSNLIDNRSLYVALSRARDSVQLYTDDAQGLTAAIEARSGDKEVALENVSEREKRTEIERERTPARKKEKEKAAEKEKTKDKKKEHEHDGHAAERSFEPSF